MLQFSLLILVDTSRLPGHITLDRRDFLQGRGLSDSLFAHLTHGIEFLRKEKRSITSLLWSQELDQLLVILLFLSQQKGLLLLLFFHFLNVDVLEN